MPPHDINGRDAGNWYITKQLRRSFAADQRGRIVIYEAKHRQKKVMAEALMRELRDYQKSGTQLYIGDEPCSPREIVKACVFSEDGKYMRDFVMNDSEKVSEIHFVKLREK